MGTMFRNWWTTIFGVLGGLVNHINTTGVKMPETKQEFGSFLFSLLIVALGVVAKDATTGSAPK